MRQITRSEGNVLFELDGKPALELYKTYLGEHAAGLPATGLLFPLNIRRPEQERTLVRTAYTTIIYEINDFGLSIFDRNLNVLADCRCRAQALVAAAHRRYRRGS